MKFRFKSRTSTDVPWENIASLDLIWGALAPAIALVARDPVLFSWSQLDSSLIYVGVSALLTAASFIWFRLSHSVSRYFSVDDALSVLKASAVAVGVTVVICFLLWRLDNIPRSVPITHFAILSAGNIAGRMQRYLRRRRRDRPSGVSPEAENILIIGVSDLCWYYIQFIESMAGDLLHVVALVDDSKSLQNRFVHGYPVAGRVKDLDAIFEEYENHGVRIDRLVIASQRDALPAPTRKSIEDSALRRGIPVDDLEERLGFSHRQRPAAKHQQQDIMPFALHERRTFWKTKRAFDIGVSAFLLLLGLPLVALLSILVLLDLGAPLLFWQIRVGRGGRKITIYKFRTLQARYRSDEQPLSWTDRVSPFGKFLRRTHLDEIPQLLGILSGEMSLVGPRPLLPVDLAENVGLRTTVRPGITGWAQVNGGTLLTRDEKNALDEWYVRNASWKLDVKILLSTFLELFRQPKRNEIAVGQAVREQSSSKTNESGPVHDCDQRNAGEQTEIRSSRSEAMNSSSTEARSLPSKR
jgi:lipopolysaccharide/colanic/teichoic acid biosynthesis glycosyltransferase